MTSERAGDGPAPVPAKRRRRLVWRVLGLLLVALSLYYAYRTVGDEMRGLDWHSLQVHWGPLVLAVGLTVVCVGLGAVVWQCVLRGVGHSLPLGECLRVQTASNMAKYLPGYAWQLLGKGYLTTQGGVPAGTTTVAILLELALSLSTAVLVAWASMPAAPTLPALSWVSRPIWWTGLLLVALFLAAFPWVAGSVLRFVSARFQRVPLVTLEPRHLWYAILWLLGSWLIFGASYALTMRSLQAVGYESYGVAIFVLSLSFVVGLLTPFVPGGIGVREGTMIYALTPLLPAEVAALVAVFSRVALVVSEVGAFGAVQAWTRARGAINGK